MPRNVADRIRDKIRAYAENPTTQANNIRRLRGPDRLLRLRVGDWRVVMQDAQQLEILHIAARSGAYKE